MLRKLFVISSLLILLMAVASQTVFSQDTQTSSSSLFNTYKEAQATYTTNHEAYLLARSQYLRFGTQKSKTDAIAATKAMLVSRDEVVIAYIKLLAFTLQDAKGVTEETRQELALELIQEEEFFIDHKQRISSAQTLEELVSDSDEAAVRFENDHKLFYKVMSYLSTARVSEYSRRFNLSRAELVEKVSQIKAETRDEYILDAEKLLLIDRWLLESENSVDRADQKLVESINSIALLDDDRGQNNRFEFASQYNHTINLLQQTTSHFTQAIRFLDEVLQEITTKPQTN